MVKKRIRIVSTLMLAAVLAGCGTFSHKTQTSIENLPENERPKINTSIEGNISKQQIAGKNVFVSFKNSKKLTGVLSGIVTNNGGQIVMSAENADLILDGQGGFLADRPFGSRHVRANIGEIFEKGGDVASISKDVYISLQPTLLGNIADQASDVTGFRAWFNNLVGADPDGICLVGCEGKMEYEQAVVIEVTLKESDGKHISDSKIVAQTKHRELWPIPLINAALNKLASSEVWTQ